MVVAPGLMLDNFLPIRDAESLPFYHSVLKLVVYVCHNHSAQTQPSAAIVHRPPTIAASGWRRSRPSRFGPGVDAAALGYAVLRCRSRLVRSLTRQYRLL